MVGVWSTKYFQILEYFVIVINGRTNVLVSSKLRGGECHFPPSLFGLRGSKTLFNSILLPFPPPKYKQAIKVWSGVSFLQTSRKVCVIYRKPYGPFYNTLTIKLELLLSLISFLFFNYI